MPTRIQLLTWLKLVRTSIGRIRSAGSLRPSVADLGPDGMAARLDSGPTVPQRVAAALLAEGVVMVAFPAGGAGDLILGVVSDCALSAGLRRRRPALGAQLLDVLGIS